MNIKALVILVLSISFKFALFSQSEENRAEHLETLFEDLIIEPDSLLIFEDLFIEPESLINIEDYFIESDNLINLDTLPEYPTDLVIDSPDQDESLPEELSDLVYITRLSAINTPIEMPFNEQVKSHIKLYSQKRRDQVENMLGLSEYYFPIFEEYLDARNMPLELKYLPVIESALNPRALSRAGASGIWQFMLATGRLYKLEVNSFIDERRDPVKSTYAAVNFLSDLYDIYGDWHLAIAAYNCGPGNVNKAIRRSGGKRDFWEIYYQLPRETRGYVPAFIAATYIMTYATEHNLYPKPANLPEISDTIMIYQPLHFEQVSQILQIPVETLRDMNPQYRRDVIPAKEDKSYALKLTSEQSLLFASYEDSIYNHRRQHYFPNNRLVVTPSDTKYSVVAPDGRAAVYYTVKSGDVLGKIAEWFNVRVSDLRYWNDISGNMIKVGQRLVIYVPKNKEEHYKAVAQARSGKSTSTTTTTTNKTASSQTQNQTSENKNYEYYVVKSGDTVWTIAQKYPGVTNEDILRLNNITDAKKIKPGQKLKIRVI